jgi:hypothetical protein
MTNFIPIFPLGIVVYPGEQLNLHIFEPRYRQLITKCWLGKKPFGIPPVINNAVNEWGTLVEITEISKIYEDGKMDIKTTGTKVFRTLEIIKDVPGKLYSAAIVTYPENGFLGSPGIMKKIISGIRKLHHQLDFNKEFQKPDESLSSYDVAHFAGLSLQEEYELLCLLKELFRQEYLKRHLAKIAPLVNEIDLLKKRIKLNGHFKNLESFDF